MLLSCKYADICQNHTENNRCQLHCSLSPYSRSGSKARFVSRKCRAFWNYCANRYSPETCVDCDPFDSPCSLFRLVQSGGDDRG